LDYSLEVVKSEEDLVAGLANDSAVGLVFGLVAYSRVGLIALVNLLADSVAQEIAVAQPWEVLQEAKAVLLADYSPVAVVHGQN